MTTGRSRWCRGSHHPTTVHDDTQFISHSTATARGWCDTASLGSMVTDSSAASSAWATGTRVMNGSVNVLPDGRRLTPIGVLARQAGLRVGLVTTTTITHATPAGFVAVQPRRDDEEAIASQYLNVVDVLLGGGRQFFDASRRSDRKDLLSEYRAAGYHLCDTRAALLAAPADGQILGLFDSGHLPYLIDLERTQISERVVPTLEDMTTKALAMLRGSPRGFLLQVEGGRVDHAAHANDAAAALRELLAFDDALGVVLDHARQTADTLVVVTSDHGNSNPGLNGLGHEYADSTRAFESLARFKTSSGSILQQLGQGRDSHGRVSPAFAADVIREVCGIELPAGEAATLAPAGGGVLPSEVNRQHANASGILAQVLGNHTGIGWTGMSHTADLTAVLATGPGQDRFAGLRLNTETFTTLTDSLGLKFTNPSMSCREAARYGSNAFTDSLAHWL
ncbi:MAG: alkaline phosphatase [Acidobacteria bacterium]|nr:MAG: alkaline phosphatase [Acidobacteriota bacterium]